MDVKTTLLTAENEQYLEAQVAAGRFSSLKDAINELVESERRWNESVKEKVAAGIADLESGRFADYNETSLAGRFDELKQRAGKAISSSP